MSVFPTTIITAVFSFQHQLILREHPGDVHALAAHPFKYVLVDSMLTPDNSFCFHEKRHWLLIGSYAGLLKLWDYSRKYGQLVMMLVFKV